jgi:hypothetical protein
MHTLADAVVVEQTVLMHLCVVKVSWVLGQWVARSIHAQPDLCGGLCTKRLQVHFPLQVTVVGIPLKWQAKFEHGTSRAENVHPCLLVAQVAADVLISDTAFVECSPLAIVFLLLVFC